jgi:molecular chaperone GrpE (heat shock protein)
VARGISEERRFAERETLTEKLRGLIEEVSGLREEGEEEPSDLEAVQEENADLKAALFGLTQELVELQTRIQEMQETTRTEAVVTFLSEMNSPASGYLLDNVVQSNRATTQLLEEGWLPEPPEVEGVVYSLKMLMDYLARIGVTPMQPIGARAKVSLEDLAYLNYSGSEFRNEKELKWIEFRSSGWIYQGAVISRPRAVEAPAPAQSQGGDA